jgi:2-succinyl-5-enolpyruvyl-6-hydroxy-3-cyclohexene-1-carboxylate synthase
VNPSTTQARVVVDELIRGGVRDVVLCPGSRNAPLAFALADADRAGRLRLHVRIDERTAGYLAIGLAAGSGRPVPIAMTSGTAVANLGPAVVEANYARVPLIVLSANRPYELLGTGANQTMEQLGYFGTQVRGAISLGLATGTGVDALGAPRPFDAQNASWRSATCRVLAAATGARTANAGPVQFDIPLREPLVPEPDSGPEDCPSGRPEGRPWTYSPPVSFDQPLPIDLTPDTVVISGHGAGVHPNLAHLPTVAEPTAPCPATPAPSGVGAARRSGDPGVRADHRTALARRVRQLDGHRHPCRDLRHPRPGLVAPLRRGARPGRRRGARAVGRPPVDHRPARGRCRRRGRATG